MTKLTIVFAAFAFVGCAAGTRAHDPSVPSFPAKVSGDTQLQQTGAFNHLIKLQHAGQLETDVYVCVTPAGTVDSVRVIDAPEDLVAFKAALAAKIQSWQFAPYTAADGTLVCDSFTVQYHAG